MVMSVTNENIRATYAVRIADVTPVALATDVLVLTGANGKILRISKISVSGSATAASLLDLYISKRTTLNSGGTSTVQTITKYDSLDPNPSGVVTLYSVNATSLGTGSSLEGDKIYLPAQATPAGEPTHWLADYTGLEAKCPILRNANESISINLSGIQTIPPGTSLYLYIEWTEEFGV